MNTVGFMSSFRKSLVDAAKASPVVTLPMWEHQCRMYDAGLLAMLHEERIRVICATGGGKTRVEIELLKAGFQQLECKIQVLVAPTIALLCQHDVSAFGFGLFATGDVVTVHFRTGADPRKNAENFREDVTVSTSVADLLKTIHGCCDSNKKLMLFVTYDSIEKMFALFDKHEIVVDNTVWDEFHHTVRTDVEWCNFIKNVPSKRNVFFSASSKSNRRMSSFDERLYGKLGANITFSELRAKGYLVPRIVLKILRLSQMKRAAKHISEKMKKEGVREGVDIELAALEAAAVITARLDMKKEVGPSNVLVFGKSRAQGEIEFRSQSVRDALKGAELFAVYAGTAANDRVDAFEAIRESQDSVLWQHSVVKEGIDVTAFNALILCRGMELIGLQQAIGRVVRNHSGVWKKDRAVVYVMVNDENMVEFEHEVEDLIKKLIGAGLKHEGDFVCQLADVDEERTSVELDEGGVLAPVMTDAFIEKAALQSKLAKLVIEVVDVEEYDLELDECIAKSESVDVAELF